MKINKENFLLDNETSKKLYENNKDVPIFDFHCHLDPTEIYYNEPFENITQLWLKHDHYKWRLMRAFGVEERKITGNANDFEKFEAFVNALKYAFMNPIYHWCTLELNKYFNVNINYEEVNIRALYNELNAKLQSSELLPRSIIKSSNVKAICTTDDPADDLKYHKLLEEDDTFNVTVLPTFRPDAYIDFSSMNLEENIKRLESVTDINITTLEEYIRSLHERINYFKEHGCKASDHSFEKVPVASINEEEAAELFEKFKNGEEIGDENQSKLTSYTFKELSAKYKEFGFVTQLHLGPLRNNNTAMKDKIGRDAGFDSVGNSLNLNHFNEFLDYLKLNNVLSNMIIYPNNANDHLTIQAAAGNFTNDDYKIQLGAAWWYNDTKEGMERHLIDYANVGILGTFVGMLTDSRSLLSFTRHDYFRRILCNQLGVRMERGEITNNIVFVSSVIEDICFNNSIDLFGVKLEEEK